MSRLDIQTVLGRAVANGASDVHVVAGIPVKYRIAGELRSLDDDVMSPDDTAALCFAMLSEEQRADFRENRDIDLIQTIDKHRFRINLSFSNNQVGAVVRVLNYAPMPLETLHLPPIVRDICLRDKGLFLITGTTSQGKTTTLSAMVDYINRHRSRHVVSIEDPIEYIHENKQSIIRQREVGRDTDNFETGLKAALRQDPDVIVIGEMRDYESIKIALTAAETGSLVLSTLHTMSIDKIIERLFSYVPGDQEAQIRMMLAEVLLGAIHQELLPTLDGGKRVAAEVLVATNAVRSTLRRRETFYLKNYIQTGGKQYGMRTMRQSLDELREAGEISDDIHDSVLLNYT